MSYVSTLKWYAENDPRDFDNLIELIEKERDLVRGKPDQAGDLSGRKIALVVGHEPGGGAKGEREWNLKVARRMDEILKEAGAEVLVYEHKVRAYSRRIDEMRKGVKKHLPGAEVVLLMHYNSVDYPNAEGHEFHYRASKELAESMRDAWQAQFPSSRARRDNGILENRSGRGSGMIKAAPAPCCLLEPFFESNPAERKMFMDAIDEVSGAYVEGLRRFLAGGS